MAHQDKTTGNLASVSLPDEFATVNLGEMLADIVGDGDTLLLGGDLGAGKTALARALIRRLCGAEIEVPSPTFTLLQDYDAEFGPIHHFDLYRIEHPDEALEIGFEDALGDGLCLIEWPDRLEQWLPREAIRIDLEIDGDGRAATLSGDPAFWRSRLESSEHWAKLRHNQNA